jgi:AcrR family transcriptional regulator
VPQDVPDSTLRIDAQRSRHALLEAAHKVFAERGIDVPFEDVGRAAGVGKGTLYRHFPTRDDLYAAVSLERFAGLQDRATRLAASADPWRALVAWLEDFDRSSHHYRGLSARVSEGIGRVDSAVARACEPMRAEAGKLLLRAQDAGEVISALDIQQLLTMVSALPDDFRNPDGSSNLLNILLRGIHEDRR